MKRLIGPILIFWVIFISIVVLVIVLNSSPVTFSRTQEAVRLAILNSNADWKIYSTPQGGFSLASPFSIDMDIQGKGSERSTSGRLAANKALLNLSFTYTHFSHKQNGAQWSQTISDTEKRSVQEHKNSSWSLRPISSNGAPATQIDYAYPNGDSVTRGTKFLLSRARERVVLDMNSDLVKIDPNTYSQWSQRIINSMKLDAQ